jgi:hypothetical protein
VVRYPHSRRSLFTLRFSFYQEETVLCGLLVTQAFACHSEARGGDHTVDWCAVGPHTLSLDDKRAGVANSLGLAGFVS